jgi:hypothetical protein
VTFLSLPDLDNLTRLAGFVAILCSTASMASSVIALFRYKADMERAVYLGGEGLLTLSVRPDSLLPSVSAVLTNRLFTATKRRDVRVSAAADRVTRRDNHYSSESSSVLALTLSKFNTLT